MRLPTLRKLLTLCLILYPITSIYGFEKISLGMIFILSIIILLILKNGIKMEFPKYMGTYAIYMIFTRFLWGLSVNLADIVSLNILTFFITLGFACKYFDFDFGIRTYRIIGFLASIFFLVQLITLYSFGFGLSGILPKVPLTFIPNIETDSYRDFISGGFRQSSFLREPAYFAQFLLPILVIELFDKKRKGIHYISALFITLVILLGASGCGFVGLVVIWTSWLFLEFKNGAKGNKILVLFLILSFVFMYGPAFMLSERGEAITKRIYGVRTMDESSISSYVRTYRGYYVFDEYNWFEKLFGINNPKLQIEKVKGSPVRFLFGNEMYFNGIQSVLILTGFIGFVLLFLSYRSLWVNNSDTIKVLLLLFIVESLIEAIFLNASMLVYLILLYSLHNRKSRSFVTIFIVLIPMCSLCP